MGFLSEAGKVIGEFFFAKAEGQGVKAATKEMNAVVKEMNATVKEMDVTLKEIHAAREIKKKHYIEKGVHNGVQEVVNQTIIQKLTIPDSLFNFLSFFSKDFTLVFPLLGLYPFERMSALYYANIKSPDLQFSRDIKSFWKGGMLWATTSCLTVSLLLAGPSEGFLSFIYRGIVLGIAYPFISYRTYHQSIGQICNNTEDLEKI